MHQCGAVGAGGVGDRVVTARTLGATVATALRTLVAWLQLNVITLRLPFEWPEELQWLARVLQRILRHIIHTNHGYLHVSRGLWPIYREPRPV